MKNYLELLQALFIMFAPWIFTFVTPALLLTGFVIAIVRFKKRGNDDVKESIKRKRLVVILSILTVLNIAFAASVICSIMWGEAESIC
ncbi:MAG: hypothetical protein K5761_01685 [Clostridiales bacterium]|nr:hypothetical protein [Clostridiales bacterium]